VTGGVGFQPFSLLVASFRARNCRACLQVATDSFFPGKIFFCFQQYHHASTLDRLTGASMQWSYSLPVSVRDDQLTTMCGHFLSNTMGASTLSLLTVYLAILFKEETK
jgi:hypothetical protein